MRLIRTCHLGTLILVSLLFTLFCGTAWSYGEKGNQRKGPPQAAIDACAGKEPGGKVKFETPRGDILSGTCQKLRGQLIAVPAGFAERGRKLSEDR